jgi:hypothetical protein
VVQPTRSGVQMSHFSGLSNEAWPLPAGRTMMLLEAIEEGQSAPMTIAGQEESGAGCPARIVARSRRTMPDDAVDFPIRRP